jgi:hypothetical protein
LSSSIKVDMINKITEMKLNKAVNVLNQKETIG